jgi:transcriptional regulator with XRE-family HTH domain
MIYSLLYERPISGMMRTERRENREGKMEAEVLIMEQFPARLRRLREAAGMSRDQLARDSKLTTSWIYKLEGGDTKRPSLKTLSALAAALKVNVSELSGEEEKSPDELQSPEEQVARSLSLVMEGIPAEERAEFARLISYLDLEQIRAMYEYGQFLRTQRERRENRGQGRNRLSDGPGRNLTGNHSINEATPDTEDR